MILPCNSELPVLLALDVKIVRGMKQIMALPGFLVVEDRITKLALYQALGRRRPFLKIKTIMKNKGENTYLSTFVE